MTIVLVEWIDNNIKNGRVLYINKIKSAHLLESEGSDSPSRANLMSTFSTFIISDAMKNVKTEEDLAALLNDGHFCDHRIGISSKNIVLTELNYYSAVLSLTYSATCQSSY